MPDGIKIFDDALLHFGRGLIGKSDGQYAGCRDVLKQQGNVAGSQRVGFPVPADALYMVMAFMQ